jgi:hypothetical protein
MTEAGNDGLTDSERQDLADKYMREAAAEDFAAALEKRPSLQYAAERQRKRWEGVNRRLADM